MCPKEAFDVALNGLSFFLSQYPHMDEEQLDQVKSVIRTHSNPYYKQGKLLRQALQCSVGSDGTLHISPAFVENDGVPRK